MKKIKILIVDDHMLIREGLKQILALSDDIEIIGEASSGFECLEFLEKSELPALILMDIKMPGINGIETARLINEKYPEIKIIILTIYKEEQYVTDAINAGVKGYALKNIRRDEIIQIINLVMEKDAFLSPDVAAGLISHIKNNKYDNDPSAAKEHLSKRELEILSRLVTGNTDKEIADNLCISEFTVRSHVRNLYRKLGVSSRAQAVAIAIRKNIIE